MGACCLLGRTTTGKLSLSVSLSPIRDTSRQDLEMQATGSFVFFFTQISTSPLSSFSTPLFSIEQCINRQ
jgi:hypothetical protein